MDELRYDGRVAVITGGGRGLGRAYALLLGARGAKVVVNDPGVSRQGDGFDAGPAEEVAAEIRAAGGEAIANTDSVATPEGAAGIIGSAIDAFGRVDILIHNAGANRPGPIAEVSWEDLSNALGVHLHGAFHVARAALPHMYAAGYGRIVMTSSIAGLYSERNLAAYCVGKAGQIGLTQVLALEGAEHGVKCNAIVPAAVTRLSEGRDVSGFPPMTPEQVAPMVAWMAHESCEASGQMFVALAGRMAQAYVTETRGVYQPEWTIEQVAEQREAIGDRSQTVTFAPFPSGFAEHLGYSFDMARGK